MTVPTTEIATWLFAYNLSPETLQRCHGRRRQDSEELERAEQLSRAHGQGRRPLQPRKLRTRAPQLPPSDQILIHKSWFLSDIQQVLSHSPYLIVLKDSLSIGLTISIRCKHNNRWQHLSRMKERLIDLLQKKLYFELQRTQLISGTSSNICSWWSLFYRPSQHRLQKTCYEIFSQ